MKRILIVDDEKEIRGLLAETFAMEGYITDQAADGKDALSGQKHRRRGIAAAAFLVGV